jgi:membrane glycosyltransferase
MDDYGLLQAVVDPYINAVHVSFLRAKEDPPHGSEERFVGLRSALLRKGPMALAPRERLSLLMDADSMHVLHHELWATPAAGLAEWWQLALKHYSRLAPAPSSPFTSGRPGVHLS